MWITERCEICEFRSCPEPAFCAEKLAARKPKLSALERQRQHDESVKRQRATRIIIPDWKRKMLE